MSALFSQRPLVFRFFTYFQQEIMSSSDARASPPFCFLGILNDERLRGSPAVVIPVGRRGHNLASLRTESLTSGSSKFSNFASNLTEVNDNSHAGASRKMSENLSDSSEPNLSSLARSCGLGRAIRGRRVTYVDSISLQSAEPSAFERFIDLRFAMQYDCSDCRRVKSRLRPPVCLGLNPFLFAFSLLRIDSFFDRPNSLSKTSLHRHSSVIVVPFRGSRGAVQDRRRGSFERNSLRASRGRHLHAE
jgi:hypothetical protein